jgi:hypothetical protein
MNYARLLPALELVQDKEQHKPEIRLTPPTTQSTLTPRLAAIHEYCNCQKHWLRAELPRYKMSH